MEPAFAVEPSAQPLSRAWQGRLALEFAHRAGKTILSRSQVQAPLKVQRPFYPEGDACCHSVMLHTAGGIVGGDRLNIAAQLQPNTQALITSAAATKVYRSNGLEAQQQIHLQIAAGACLEWLPQETIVFDGALYRQQLKIELETGATWLGWEITRLGRSARNEQFTSGEWRSRTEVWQDNRLIWVDPQRVQGGSEMLTSLHGLAGFPVIASLAFVGQPISEALLAKVRSIELADQATPETELKDKVISTNILQTGVTCLPNGLVCRYRGTSTAAARNWFIAIWHLLRQELLERQSCIPRVWQI